MAKQILCRGLTMLILLQLCSEVVKGSDGEVTNSTKDCQLFKYNTDDIMAFTQAIKTIFKASKILSTRASEYSNDIYSFNATIAEEINRNINKQINTSRNKLVTKMVKDGRFECLSENVWKKDCGTDVIVAKFEEFCMLASSGKDKINYTSKANGVLIANCWQKKFGKYDIKTITDNVVLPVCMDKDKHSMTVNKANVDKFISTTAREVVKRKTKNHAIALADPGVQTVQKQLIISLCRCFPNKIPTRSSTGIVKGLTDTRLYTGAQKDRFYASTYGNAAIGRPKAAEHSGYFESYKGYGGGENVK